MTGFKRFTNLFWGEQPLAWSISRSIVKIVVALLLATVVHESIARYFATMSDRDVSLVEKSVVEANRLLKTMRIKSFGETESIQICAGFTSSLDFNCRKSDADGRGLQYGLMKNTEGSDFDLNTKIVIFTVQSVGFISTIHVSGSLDTVSRVVEEIAFNARDTPPSRLELCAGTPKSPQGPGCTLTAKVQAALSVGFDRILQRVRVASLFIGVIQWGTFGVFFYAMIEALGLWLRWVCPAPTLYHISLTDGAPRLTPSENLEKLLIAYSNTPVRALGDRLFVRSLAAANSSDPKTPSSNEEVVATLEAYRVSLIDDATARQDIIDLLSDTMLKLAFLGTVYGISDALFVARGLDTSNPIVKAMVRSEMYSGIGIGFGTTLVGIFLSIGCGFVRSNLLRSWSAEVHAAYRSILDFTPELLIQLAKSVSLPAGTIPPPPPKTPRLDVFVVFGTLIVVGALLAVLWLFTRGLN